MNTETGELRRIAMLTGEGHSMSEAVKRAIREGFTPVPEEHEAEAYRIIEKAEAERTLAFADMTAPSPLVNWAKSQQKKPYSNHKTKMAKASRRRNRQH